MKGKYNMNTKGKIDFTKTDNIQFIEEVASEISKEDKNWQWEAREIKQHSLLLWWEYLEDEKQEGFRIEYDEAEEVFSVYDEWDNDITYELEDTLDLKSTMRISREGFRSPRSMWPIVWLQEPMASAKSA